MGNVGRSRYRCFQVHEDVCACVHYDSRVYGFCVVDGGGVESWFRFEHTVAEVLESGSTILEFRRQGASKATLGRSFCSYTCYHRN